VKTVRLTVDANGLETEEAGRTLDRAAGILQAGGLVALPTETVYGLGANALDGAAVERVFAAKGRPKWDPVIVHVASPGMLEGLVTRIPETGRQLMGEFWPGPLTLLLERTSAVPDAVTAGRALVGVRMPAHPVALELIRRAGVPVAAPSANRFGHISPTRAEHVLDDLDGRIDAVLDAGPTERGIESTVIDPEPNPMVIYRPGAVTVEQIGKVAGPVELYGSGELLLEAGPGGMPSPGVAIRHYAPKARLVLVDAPLSELDARLGDAAREWQSERVGVMLPSEVRAPREIPLERIYAWGKWSEAETLARRLYDGLRTLDRARCGVIVCPLPREDGLGAAIRDRLRKAGNRERGIGNREQE